MYHFGKSSMKKIANLHPDLKAILSEVIDVMDITVLEGYRTKEKQLEFFNSGKSKVKSGK